MRIYIDLDDTIFEYTKAYNEALERNPKQPFPQSAYGFFADLVPKKDAVKSYYELKANHSVYFLTAPSIMNPMSYCEKRVSIEKWFGLDACKNLIICHDKSLLKGNFLIDDRVASNKQYAFEGTLLEFGGEKYPDWKAIMKYFKNEKLI